MYPGTKVNIKEVTKNNNKKGNSNSYKSNNNSKVDKSRMTRRSGRR